jgi:hypothetical protein
MDKSYAEADGGVLAAAVGLPVKYPRVDGRNRQTTASSTPRARSTTPLMKAPPTPKICVSP